jgi:hypothetical protein
MRSILDGIGRSAPSKESLFRLCQNRVVDYENFMMEYFLQWTSAQLKKPPGKQEIPDHVTGQR